MSGIVIIEDDEPMRTLLVEWLTAEGYHARGATSMGAEVQAPADLVIVNVYMPRHLGGERLRPVRSTYPHAPIIAISGQFHSGMRYAGPAAGALGVERVIPKPFDQQALLDAVRSVIGPPGLMVVRERTECEIPQR